MALWWRRRTVLDVSHCQRFLFYVYVGRQRKWFSLDEARQQLFRHRPTMCDYLDLLRKPGPVSDDQPLESVSSCTPPSQTATPSWRDEPPFCPVFVSTAVPTATETGDRDADFFSVSLQRCHTVCIVGTLTMLVGQQKRHLAWMKS